MSIGLFMPEGKISLDEYSPHFDSISTSEIPRTDYIFLLLPGERIRHPQRIKDFRPAADAYFLPRWFKWQGNDVFPLGQHAWSLRMAKRDKIERIDDQIITRDGILCAHAVEFSIEKEIDSSEYLKLAESASDPLSLARAKRIIKDGIRKILLSYNGIVGIGDTLMTIPALRELHRRYPQAEITYRSQVVDVLAIENEVSAHRFTSLCPYIDFVDNTPPGGYGAQEKAYLESFDMVLGFETCLTGDLGKRLNGYELSSWWVGMEPHDGDWTPEWYFRDSELDFATQFMDREADTEYVLAIGLAASCLHRTWPYIEELAEDMLRSHEDLTLITFGSGLSFLLEKRSPAPRWRFDPKSMRMHRVYESPPWHDESRFIAASEIDPKVAMAFPPERRARSLRLREAAAVLSLCDMLFTPDSGLMHIAAAIGLPTLAYFSLVPAHLRIKHFPFIIPIEADYPCSPCFVHGRIKCILTTELGAPCLASIGYPLVRERLEEMLYGQCHQCVGISGERSSGRSIP